MIRPFPSPLQSHAAPPPFLPLTTPNSHSSTSARTSQFNGTFMRPIKDPPSRVISPARRACPSNKWVKSRARLGFRLLSRRVTSTWAIRRGYGIFFEPHETATKQCPSFSGTSHLPLPLVANGITVTNFPGGYPMCLLEAQDPPGPQPSHSHLHTRTESNSPTCAVDLVIEQ